jgi:hypothetical protein
MNPNITIAQKMLALADSRSLAPNDRNNRPMESLKAAFTSSISVTPDTNNSPEDMEPKTSVGYTEGVRQVWN